MLARTRWASQWPERTHFRPHAASVQPHASAAREAVQSVPFLAWAISAGFAFPPAAIELLSWCESPGEAFLVREFAARDDVFLHANMACWNGRMLALQHPCWNYRIDLVLRRGDAKLAIEVDGLSFHGSQKDFARDCLRQRRMTCAGYTVVRFTAKEAMANPYGCWRQIDRILDTRSKARKANGPAKSPSRVVEETKPRLVRAV
jgi:very-short-patch-repair endonuclease